MVKTSKLQYLLVLISCALYSALAIDLINLVIMFFLSRMQAKANAYGET